VRLSYQTTSLIIQVISLGLWFPLKVLGIQAIWNAGARRYPLVFAYAVVTFLLVVVQAPLSLSYYRSLQGQQWFETVYYSSQGLAYALLIGVVLSFLYSATDRYPGRRVLRLALSAAGLLFIALSGWVEHDARVPLGAWVTRWTRDLNFGAAVLDLALWGMLIAVRRPDSKFLLLLTGGMGIMFSGEAIGNAVRDIGIRERSLGVYFTGHGVVILADAISLYVWWQAFRKEAASQEALTATNHR
jgi:hypothetical protein